MIPKTKRKSSILAYVLIISMLAGLLPTTAFAQQEQTFVCGKELHTHNEQCFDDDENLICELEEHEHTEQCLSESAKGDIQQQVTEKDTTENTEQTSEDNKQDKTEEQTSEDNKQDKTEEQTSEDNKQDKTEEQTSEDNEQDKTEEQTSEDNEQDKTEEQTSEEDEQEIEQIQPKRKMRAVRANENHTDHTDWEKLTTGKLNITSSGNYYLDEDITINDPLRIRGEADSDTVKVTLCLNGHTLTGNNVDAVIKVVKNAELTLCDCSGNNTGKITGGGTGVQVLSFDSSIPSDEYNSVSSTFNMNGGTISENKAEDGGGVYVSDSRFNMNGGTITNNIVEHTISSGGSSGGGVYVSNSIFNMNGGIIKGNTAISGDGAGVYVGEGSTFTMKNGKISNTIEQDTDGNIISEPVANNGGGVYVRNAKFIMRGGTITNHLVFDTGGGVCIDRGNFEMSNNATIESNIVIGKYDDDDKLFDGSGNGGGVAVIPNTYGASSIDDGSTFTMTGGTIGGSGEKANMCMGDGGGVYVGAYSTFEMSNNSKITYNNAMGDASGGGGVCVVGKNATFTMNAGEINNNYATVGGGGVFVSDGKFTMKNGTITGNQAGDSEDPDIGGGDGGGVYVLAGELEMQDGKISNNTAYYNENTSTGGDGGGVYVNNSTFTMSGNSAINNNTADSIGGGVLIYDDSTFTMQGGTVTENRAIDGGGVFVGEQSAVFNVSGAAVVANNTTTDTTADTINNNVYLSSGKEITVTGKLTGGANIIGVTTGTSPTESNPVGVAQGDRSYIVEDTDKAYFTSDNINYIVDFNDTSNTVVLRLPYTFTVTFNTDGGSTVDPQEIPEGQKAIRPETDPTKDGFIFEGWYKEAAFTTPFDFETEVINADTTIYAKWIKKVTVTFNTDGGSTVGPQEIPEGQKATRPETDPTKDGFIFEGWYKEAAFTTPFNFDTAINENTTIYAKWVEKVTITFESNGGSTIDNLDIAKGETVTQPADPTKSGYIFVGWYSDEELTTEYNFNEPVIADITLYAKWEKAPNKPSKKYSISGTVKYQNGIAIQNAVVKANSITAVTDAQGKYTLSNLPQGVYDVIATIKVDGIEKTASKRVSLISGNINDADIIFTVNDVSTEIKVPSGGSSGEVNTNDIIVKGLDEEAKKHSEPDASVKLTLTIQSEDNDKNKQAKKAIQKEAKQSELEGFDISLEKTVTKDGVTTTTKIEQTQTILELIVPFETSNKQNVSVYRYYDGEVSKLKKLSSEPTVLQDGTFWIDGDNIHIYIDKMAYYAIVYDKKSSEKPASNGKTGTWVKDNKTNDKDNTDETENKTPMIPNTKPEEEIPQINYNNCTKDSNCPLTKFVDIDVYEWYHDGVHYCIQEGLMSGTSNTTFDPNIKATRAMIVAMLWRIENQPIVNDTITFNDMEQNAYYTDAVRWAVSVGIISGYDEKTFAPNDSITREQMASILYRYAQYKGKDVSTAQNTVLNYEDISDISSYALEAMKWACSVGIINGTSSTTLSPKGNTTRAQVAQMLKVYLNQ